VTSDLPSPQPQRPTATSWILFAAGLVSVPCIFLIASEASQPSWDWDTSVFGRHFALPLLILSFGCCGIAPFLSPMPFRRRLGFLVGALVVFAIVLLVTLVVCAMIFGTGIR
jgi:hypothetical protein